MKAQDIRNNLNGRKMTPELYERFKSVVDEKGYKIDKEELERYSRDETEDLVFSPDLVLLPKSTEEVVEIVKICDENNIPITPRGAGTGLSGGALPLYGGVALSMERMNRILEIDERNLQATVQPGVITQVFQEAVIEKGLFYPPDPASRGTCFIGGNVAENSGGPKAVKYGVTKDYVLNLEVVLPSGEVIETGANVLKNATGYNLTQLFVGSEGTLGIITKIVFRLIPYPTKDMLMLVPFNDPEDACSAVSAIFRKGIVPSGLEFIERDALELGMKFVNDASFELPDEIQAHLLVEVDGNNENELIKACEEIHDLLQGFNCGEILFADSAAQKERLWKIRRSLGEASKAHSVYKEEDTVVPRAELPKLLAGVKEIGRKYGFNSVCYGHAGDGNLHINILKEDLDDDYWDNEIINAIEEIFELCHQLGGTISGEHGIGYVQKEFLPIVFSDTAIQIQMEIKQLFDPKGIMNPGKIFSK